jgi:hypothetical protein
MRLAPETVYEKPNTAEHGSVIGNAGAFGFPN